MPLKFSVYTFINFHSLTDISARVVKFPGIYSPGNISKLEINENKCQ